MALPFTLPHLAPLDIHDSNAADKWKKFNTAWTNYSLATELNKKSEPIQVATLLTVIGEDGCEVFSTFTNWDSDGDNANIQLVLSKFAEYCQPRKNIHFELCRFNQQMQEHGKSYDQYRTALRMLGVGCDFHTVTPDEILQDCLVFGIKND